MILDGRRAGLALQDKEREQLVALQKELSQTCVLFDKNFSEEKGTVSFTLEELKGVPDDVTSGYNKRRDGDKELYDVTFKDPDISPVLKLADNPETRRIAFEARENRLKVNEPVLNKVLSLRREVANLLGYQHWADYATEVRLAKNAENVINFLSDLEQKLRPVGLKDREALLAIKRKEHTEKGYPFDGELYSWDYSYYNNKFISQSLDLDTEFVKEYFPVPVVVHAVLEIYQSLLGMLFVETKGETWHTDVQTFSVWVNGAKNESDFVGFFYLDLYPRPNKYSHAAVWPLIPGYDRPDGVRNYPVAAMVANLAKPTPLKPALMRHQDVVTFFHEMGHVFHHLLSETRFSRFHGTNVALDFGEAPSQMLENWCYEPEVLKRLSSHYEKQEPLSPELIDKLIESRYVNVGLFYLLQVFFSAKDLPDVTALWSSMRSSISLVKYGPPRPGQCGFPHLSSDYGAGYYGYTYSLVYASDMYARVFKQGPLDAALGERYRRSILQPGASRDELDSLKEFLGREPNSEAFVKQLFASASPDSLSIPSSI